MLRYSSFSIKRTDSVQYHTLRGKIFVILRPFFKKFKKVFPGIKIHNYFCDTVPLKACAKVLGNSCWLCSIEWLPTVSYCPEIDSPQYHTARRFPHKFGCLTPRSMILWGDWLGAVSYWAESCFGGFFSPDGMMLRGVMLLYLFTLSTDGFCSHCIFWFQWDRDV